MKIPATKYYFPPKSIDFIIEKTREILETGSFLAMGKYGEQFEKEFAMYNGNKYAVTTNSGTGALEIILRALDVEGREVIVPTNTFAATAFAVVRAGGIPVFADCLADLNVDPADVAAKITDKTKAVISVHIGGLVSLTISKLVELCKDKGIHLVEDAAHAHGSKFGGRHAGTFGVAGAFSFFSTKVMTTGEGGMIVTDDLELCEKAMTLRDQAKVRGRNYHETLGYNWRMPEFQALMGLAQLTSLEDFIQERTKLAELYASELGGIPSIELPSISEEARPNFYKYVAFLPKRVNRDTLQARLKNEFEISMGGTVYEIPLHKQPVFKEYASPNPRSEDLCARHICPPIYVGMKPEQVEYVSKSIARCIT
jgi:dTDP-4-amino-4,6-dideoxygalactose transaminase